MVVAEHELAARIEPFDSFWEGPSEVEKGYKTFGQFYKVNYLKYMPENRGANILVVSCGPGYFVNLLHESGYTRLLGIDSDSEKIHYATQRGLNCRTERAFSHLQSQTEQYDVIVCEQELNHLTKDETVRFLRLCWGSLKIGGTLIVHGLNGANPITGAEALAQNFDHFSTFTDYSLKQVLSYCGFSEATVFPLNLYVFYGNPLNYVAWSVSGLLSLLFRAAFILYGKTNRIFTKKIGGACIKRIQAH